MSSEPIDQRPQSAIVLVVEDEPLQRMDLVGMVTQAGFEVIEATDGEQAIAILEARADICILFTDIDMPGGMDGLRLPAAVRRRWPPIEIIVVTAGKRPEADDMPHGSIFLPKPIVASAAANTLERLAH